MNESQGTHVRPEAAQARLRPGSAMAPYQRARLLLLALPLALSLSACAEGQTHRAPAVSPAIVSATPAAERAQDRHQPDTTYSHVTRRRASRGLESPPGYRLTFSVAPELPSGARPAVTAFQTFWTAWWRAIDTHGRDHRYRDYLARDTVARGSASFFTDTIDSWIREDVRPVGEIRVTHLTVDSLTSRIAILRGCGDETHAGTQRSDGTKRWTFGARKQAHYQLHIAMVREHDAWRLRDYRSPFGGPSCR